MFKYLLIPILLKLAKAGHTNVSDSEIFIVAKNEDERKPIFIVNTDTSTTVRTTTTTTEPIAEINDDDDDKEEVVFIPNENKRRNRDEFFDDPVNEEPGPDLTFLNKNEDEEDAESPIGDVLFVSGKHDDDEEGRKKLTKLRNRDALQYMHQDTGVTETTATPILDCVHLDCDDSGDAVCGSKIDRGEPKYRLFFNECFYRKVNCEFRYEESRYKIVSFDKCENIAGHLKNRNKYKNLQNVILYSYVTPMMQRNQEEETFGGTRRQGSGRRSMYMNEIGTPCGHECPIVCTNDYDPQCAMTMSGEKRVFANHCQLDLDSCRTQTIWRQRPLHECVGGKKADLQNNRAFVSWMQRVGIVDKKGRLNLNK